MVVVAHRLFSAKLLFLSTELFTIQIVVTYPRLQIWSTASLLLMQSAQADILVSIPGIARVSLCVLTNDMPSLEN
jgi:hypothetical protein